MSYTDIEILHDMKPKVMKNKLQSPHRILKWVDDSKINEIDTDEVKYNDQSIHNNKIQKKIISGDVRKNDNDMKTVLYDINNKMSNKEILNDNKKNIIKALTKSNTISNRHVHDDASFKSSCKKTIGFDIEQEYCSTTLYDDSNLCIEEIEDHDKKIDDEYHQWEHSRQVLQVQEDYQLMNMRRSNNNYITPIKHDNIAVYDDYEYGTNTNRYDNRSHNHGSHSSYKKRPVSMKNKAVKGDDNIYRHIDGRVMGLIHMDGTKTPVKSSDDLKTYLKFHCN